MLNIEIFWISLIAFSRKESLRNSLFTSWWGQEDHKNIELWKDAIFIAKMVIYDHQGLSGVFFKW